MAANLFASGGIYKCNHPLATYSEIGWSNGHYGACMTGLLLLLIAERQLLHAWLSFLLKLRCDGKPHNCPAHNLARQMVMILARACDQPESW